MTWATWHREPLRLTLAGYSAMGAPALGLNADRLTALGAWERRWVHSAGKVEFRVGEGKWHKIESISMEPHPEGGAYQYIEIPMSLGVQLPRGRFGIDLRYVHPHPECPTLTDTVPVKCDTRLWPGTRIDADKPDFPVARLVLITEIDWKREGESS